MSKLNALHPALVVIENPGEYLDASIYPANIIKISSGGGGNINLFLNVLQNNTKQWVLIGDNEGGGASIDGLNDEIVNRIAADTELRNLITSLVSQEQTSRAAADAEISQAIETLDGRVDSVENSVSDVQSGLSTVQSGLSTVQNNVSTLQSNLATAQSNISNIQTSIASKADAQEVATALNSKANTSDMETALEGKADASDVAELQTAESARLSKEESAKMGYTRSSASLGYYRKNPTTLQPEFVSNTTRGFTVSTDMIEVTDVDTSVYEWWYGVKDTSASLLFFDKDRNFNTYYAANSGDGYRDITSVLRDPERGIKYIMISYHTESTKVGVYKDNKPYWIPNNRPEGVTAPLTFYGCGLAICKSNFWNIEAGMTYEVNYTPWKYESSSEREVLAVRYKEDSEAEAIDLFVNDTNDTRSRHAIWFTIPKTAKRGVSYIYINVRGEFGQVITLDMKAVGGNLIYRDRIELFDKLREYRDKASHGEGFGTAPLAFAYVTDIHANWFGMRQMINLINGYNTLERGNTIKAIICGGDTVRALNTEDIQGYWDAMDASEIPFYPCLGNHDAWAVLNHLDAQATVYAKFHAPLITKYGANMILPTGYDSNYLMYYYTDFDELRIIHLDNLYMDSDEVTWLESVLADALTNAKHVIINSHGNAMLEDVDVAESNWSLMTAQLGARETSNDYTAIPQAVIDAVDSFIDDGGKFVCYMNGHTHTDIITTMKTDERQLSINCGSMGLRALSTFKGTATQPEPLFNLFVVDTKNSIIKVVRVGANVSMYGQKNTVFVYSYLRNKIFADW